MITKKIQALRVVLKDGRSGLFYGEAIVDPSTEEPEIASAYMSMPQDAPEDYEFSLMDSLAMEKVLFH